MGIDRIIEFEGDLPSIIEIRDALLTFTTKSAEMARQKPPTIHSALAGQWFVEFGAFLSFEVHRVWTRKRSGFVNVVTRMGTSAMNALAEGFALMINERFGGVRDETTLRTPWPRRTR